MKKIKFISLFLATMAFTACSLDENPLYSVNNVTAFSSEKTANIALMGCYGYLATTSAHGQQIPQIMVGYSGLAWVQAGGSNADLGNTLIASPSDDQIKSAWAAWYKVIGECNVFIKSVAESPLSAEYKAYATAHAKFLRGFSYYHLALTFGGVPLKLEPSSMDNVAQGRTPVEKIYEQVEKDWLESAELLLPRDKMDMKDGMATKYTVYAYLAKFYYMLASKENTPSSSYWAKAKAMGDIVIKEGKYALEPKFGNLFKTKVQNSKEAIFQLNFTTVSASIGNRTSWLYSPANSTTGISYGSIRVSKAFYDQFRGTYPDDPRLNETFLSDWINIKTNKQRNFSYPYIGKNIGTSKAPVFVPIDSIDYKKLSDPTNPKRSELSVKIDSAFCVKTGEHAGWPYFKKAMDTGAEAQYTYKNIMLYRYADFLLMMADVENELGHPDLALQYANLVLERARKSGAKLATEPKAWTNALSQDELRHRIYDERLFELAGEDDLYLEVRRRGTEYLKIVVDRHNRHNITNGLIDYTTKEKYTAGWRDRLLSATPDLLKRNLLLPIPRDEINNNEAMSNADQNYGY